MEIIKYILVLFFSFLIIKILYFVFCWIRQEKYTDVQIVNTIKQNLPSNRTSIRIFKKDMKWLWNESLIVFSWLPAGPKDKLEVPEKYYPKIMVFDEIQKTSIENLLFWWKIYSKVFDLQIKNPFTWLSNNNLPPWFQLWDVYQENIKGSPCFVFQLIDLWWISSYAMYYWVLRYSFEDWYTIGPLWDWGRDFNLEKKYSIDYYRTYLNTWNIDVHDNRTLPVKNKYQKNIELSVLTTDDIFVYSTWEINIYYSLWNESSDPDECHLCDHSFLLVKYYLNNSFITNFSTEIYNKNFLFVPYDYNNYEFIPRWKLDDKLSSLYKFR